MMLSVHTAFIQTFLACSALAFISSSLSTAQPNSCEIIWGDPIRLSSDNVPSTQSRIAITGDSIHVVWFGNDTLGGQPQNGIQYSRSVDGGVSFLPQQTLASLDTALNAGFLAVAESVVCVVFTGFLNGSVGSILIRSTTAGSTWEPARDILQNTSPLFLASSDSNFVMEFINSRTRRRGILRSRNFGQTWNDTTQNAPALTEIQSWNGELHAVGPVETSVHVDVGYYVSYDVGRTWFGPTVLSLEDVTSSQYPRIAVAGDGTAYVVWNDDGTILLRRSDGYDADDELIWKPQVIVSEANEAFFPDVAASGPFVSIVWDKNFNGGSALNIRQSNNEADSYCPTTAPTNGSDPGEPSVEITRNKIHVIWSEDISGDGEIIYRRGILTPDPRPKAFVLEQNYPNPFNGSTSIGYDLPEAGFVSLALFNILGQKVVTLVEGFQEALRYQYSVEANRFPSGVYFYRLSTFGKVETKKMVITR